MRINQEYYQQVISGPRTMEALMKKHAVPGCALAVIQEGEVAFSQTYGVRDQWGAPLTPGTLFECASLTKSLFALLAMQEADQGRLDLDAPIPPLLREEPWSEDPRFLTVTPRQALSHGTGLPNWQKKPMDMKFDPGSSFSYSGEGYYLLQKLIEQNTGKSMEQLFRERFYGDFGMESSTAYWTPAVGAAFSQGFAADGSVRKVRDSRRVSGNAPEPNAAWSLYSYAYDYARFLCAMIQKRGGLSQAMFDQMTSPQNQADANISWGLGFGIPREAPTVMWHWGDNDGFQSFAVWDKAAGSGAVVNTNSDNGVAFYMELLKNLTDGAFFGQIAAFLKHAE